MNIVKFANTRCLEIFIKGGDIVPILHKDGASRK